MNNREFVDVMAGIIVPAEVEQPNEPCPGLLPDLGRDTPFWRRGPSRR
jgi:hypothetical protein